MTETLIDWLIISSVAVVWISCGFYIGWICARNRNREIDSELRILKAVIRKSGDARWG